MRPYRLYGRPGTGSFAPEMLLTEMEQPYELVPTTAEAAKSDDYRSLCPTGMVPALTLPGGETIFESAAICLHLTLAHPAAGRAPPRGTPASARFLQWMAYQATALYGAYRRIYHAEDHVAGDPACAQAVKAKGKADVDAALALLSSALEAQEGPGLLGDLGAADYYLFMLTTWHPEGAAALAGRHPGLGRLAAAVRTRPALAELIAENGG